MQQHNASQTEGGRNYWKAARERNRRQARYEIRQRVVAGASGGGAEKTTTSSTKEQQQQQREQDTTLHDPSHPSFNTHNNVYRDKENGQTRPLPLWREIQVSDNNGGSRVVEASITHSPQDILNKIVEGSRAFFSLQFLNENADFLTRQISIDNVWITTTATDIESPNKNPATDSAVAAASVSKDWIGRELYTSWFGYESSKQFEFFLQHSIETFTFIEFCVWFQRYHTLGSLILGGINPCIRGRLRRKICRKKIDQNDSNDIDNGNTGANNSTTKSSEQSNSHVDKNDMDHEQIDSNHYEDFDSRWDQELCEYGATTVLPFILRVLPPLTLSGYVVKRIVDMRRRRVYQLNHHEPHGGRLSSSCASSLGSCRLCSQSPPSEYLLYFGYQDNDINDGVENGTTPACDHTVCELCLWKDVFDHFEDEEGDVVQCPICRGSSLSSDEKVGSGDTTTTNSSPSDMYQKSLHLYLALPANARELKQRTKGKRQKVHESKILCCTWAQSVVPSLGLSRDVRRDKFFAHIEKGSYHHVKGCLEKGIDLQLTNEYGQTALYIATWLHGNKRMRCNDNANKDTGAETIGKRHCRLVQLLLHYGSDPFRPAHGGSTPYLVAKTRGYHYILDLFTQFAQDQNNYVDSTISADSALLFGNTVESIIANDGRNETKKIGVGTRGAAMSSPELTILIKVTVDHPGAGSYVIDDAVSEDEIKTMVALWERLPIEEETSFKKNKKELCSVRSYLCDAHQEISCLLLRAMKMAGITTIVAEHKYVSDCGNGETKDEVNKFIVLPHMRFLNYSQEETALAPHVDLCRVDPFDGKRSTHTFILYLTTCQEGGETTLLEDLGGEGQNHVMAKVQPRHGRLLLFPHNCPHEGEKVVSVPKLLLRGEVCIPSIDKGIAVVSCSEMDQELKTLP